MNRKWLKVLLLVLFGVFVAYSLGVLGTIGYNKYSYWADKNAVNQLQNDLMLPVARVKIEFEAAGRVFGGFGSGVVVYSEKNELGTGYDTYVLTCNHVIEYPIVKETGREGPWGPELAITGWTYGCKYVEFFDKFGQSLRKVPARVLSRSANNVYTLDEDGNLKVAKDIVDPETGQKHGEDVALLKLETMEQFPVAKLASKEKLAALKVFDKVRLVGCALGDKPIPTFGEITRIEEDFMSINAPAIFGNSGGPCYLDGTHELIGLLNMGRVTQGGFVTHMVFMRPILRAYNWLDTLGYQFVYDKTVPVDIKFNRIRKDTDTLRFQEIEERMLLQKRIAAMEKASMQIEELTKIIAEMQATNDVLDKQIAELKKLVTELEQLILQQITKKVSAVSLSPDATLISEEQSEPEPEPEPEPELEFVE